MHKRKNNQNITPSNGSLAWQIYKQYTSDILGLYILVLILFLIFALPFCLSLDPYTTNMDLRMLPPSWKTDGILKHFLGTDEYGRDYFARLLCAERNTISAAFFSTLIASLLGITIGIISGIKYKDLEKSSIHHFFDIFLSIPSILLALIIVAILGPSLKHAILAIAISLIPRFINTTYNAIQNEFTKSYINNNIKDGFSTFMLLRLTILPNILGTLSNNFFHAFSVAILDLCTIGFLGLGAQAPIPCVGNLLASGIDLMYIGSVQSTIPGLFIMLFIIAMNSVNHGLMRILDSEEDNELS